MYRQVMRLLAEPREHVSIREICRQCHVTDDTVKAIEKCEAVPIAARKQTLMLQASRIAKRAADRVEDQIDKAPLQQAVVTFGVMTDKIIALSSDNTQAIQHLHLHGLSDQDIVAFAVARSKTVQGKVIEAEPLPPADTSIPEKNGA